MKRLQAVTFDLWDTLIKERPGGSEKVAALRVRRIADILAARGAPQREETIADAYAKTAEFLDLTWSKQRDMPVLHQVLFMLDCIDQRLARKIGGEGLAQVRKVYEESLLDNPPVLLPGALETLKETKERGYKLGLISNTGRTPGTVLRILLDRMGVLEFFDATTFSDEVLVRKPADRAFRATLEALRVQARVAVHVGDDPEKDIAGAKKAGMRAIQVLEPGGERSDLADFVVSSLAEVPEKLDALRG